MPSLVLGAVLGQLQEKLMGAAKGFLERSIPVTLV
jgi:hypothetical protein